MKHIFTILFISILLTLVKLPNRLEITTSNILPIDNSYQEEDKFINYSQDRFTEVCPTDMVEVIGNYCPEVIQTCKNLDLSIHNINGYVRCLEFEPSKCLSQKTMFLHFCIDRYEFPNVKNQKPDIMISWNDMKRNCESLDKRLCYDYEWTLACEGPEILPYPYGYKRNNQVCNIDHLQKPWFDASKLNIDNEIALKLDQRVESSSMNQCISSYGVYDMTGNVDEWTINSFNKPYKSSLKGGHWILGARNRCRPATLAHNEDFINYSIGGRCCKDFN